VATYLAAFEAAGRPLEEVFVIVNEETRKPVENPVAKVLREGSIVVVTVPSPSCTGEDTPFRIPRVYVSEAIAIATIAAAKTRFVSGTTRLRLAVSPLQLNTLNRVYCSALKVTLPPDISTAS
jgi:uncharacterized Zn-finger protein